MPVRRSMNRHPPYPAGSEVFIGNADCSHAPWIRTTVATLDFDRLILTDAFGNRFALFRHTVFKPEDLHMATDEHGNQSAGLRRNGSNYEGSADGRKPVLEVTRKLSRDEISGYHARCEPDLTNMIASLQGLRTAGADASPSCHF
jgi:hypothetical protein